MKAIEVQKYMEIIVEGKAHLVLTTHVGYDKNVHMLVDNIGWMKFNPNENMQAQEMTIPF